MSHASPKLGGVALYQYPKLKLREKKKTLSAKLFEEVFVQTSPKQGSPLSMLII